MPTMILERGDDGKLRGIDERQQTAYGRFLGKMRALASSVTLTYRIPRSGKFHRRHFAMVDALYEAQEQFAEFEDFRLWGQVGAGYCTLLPGPKGKPVAIPKSINYETLEQADFEDVHTRIFAFHRTLHATRFLWPHLSDQQASDMVESVLAEFG